MREMILLCEDSPDGIFTGVYEAWEYRIAHWQVCLELQEGANFSLFAEHREVVTDRKKAEKVERTIYDRLGAEDYYHIYHALLSKDREKADWIYRLTVEGLAGKRRGSIMNKLQSPTVCRVYEMSRKTGNEAHRYIEFIRFRELKNGVLFTEIEPENQVLPLIGEHFADRFPGEHFLVYDKTHRTFLMHEAFKQWNLVEGEELNQKAVQQISETEEEMEKLWKGFCRAIAIKERKNLRLQQQFLPNKFRPYMTEMK